MNKSIAIIAKKKNLLSAEEETMLLKTALFSVNKILSCENTNVTNIGKIVMARNDLQRIQYLLPTEKEQEENLKKIYVGGQYE